MKKQVEPRYEIARKAAAIISLNGVTAGLNLITTAFLVRWFGLSIYADYTVNLAVISLSLIILEVVPTSYAVFGVQDDPELLKGLAAISVVNSVVLAFAIASTGYWIGDRQGFSAWMIPYASLMSIKRYLDIRLQSTGRLQEFFRIELVFSGSRLFLMGFLMWLGAAGGDAIWGSLALGALLAQVLWFARNPSEREVFSRTLSPQAWQALLARRKRFGPYYLGIVLKRVRDNLVPILASFFFMTKEAAGIFFLAYRGLLFTLGQIRVMEGLLNYRVALVRAARLSFSSLATLASFGQLVCLATSIALAMSAGVDHLPLGMLALLSCIVWINLLATLRRASLLSQYRLTRVNVGLAVYIITASAMAWSLRSVGMSSAIGFAGALVVSEAMALLGMTSFARKSRDGLEKKARPAELTGTQ